MNRLFKVVLIAVSLVLSLNAQRKLTGIPAVPLDEALTIRLNPVKSGTIRLNTTSSGADVVPVLASNGGFFTAANVSVQLTHDDNFQKAAQALLDGDTPILRGSTAQLLEALPAVRKAGGNLVFAQELGWSRGELAVVVRKGINRIEDLKGKRIAVQLYGQGQGFINAVLRTKNMKPTDVEFVYLRELTEPKEGSKEPADGPNGFRADDSIAAVVCLKVDQILLTSSRNKPGPGGIQIGDGSEQSVAGARLLVDTKDGAHTVAHLLAFREDWLNNNRQQSEAIVSALLKAGEALIDIRAKKTPTYYELLASAGNLFGGFSQEEVAQKLAGVDSGGYNSNVGFFTGKGTSRTLEALAGPIQQSLFDMKMVPSARVTLTKANWDYAKLAIGLKRATVVAPEPVDAAATAKRYEQYLSSERDVFAAGSNEFHRFVVPFGLAQTTFPEKDYGEEFEKILKAYEEWSGSVIFFEGHTDISTYQFEKNNGANEQRLKGIEKDAIRIAAERSEALKIAFLEHARIREIPIAPNRLYAKGYGFDRPVVKVPTNRAEAAKNRRVEVRIVSVPATAERDVFGK